MTKSEINKKMETDKWEALEIEYTELYNDINANVPDRVTFGMEKLYQIAKYRKRSLITLTEYNINRRAIERFMF